MLDPTWTATNNPHDAPAIPSPRRSRTWAAFLTRNCIVVPQQREDIKLGHYSALRKTLLTREAARADQTMLHGRDGPQVRLRSISVPEALAECRDAGLLDRIALRSAHQTASRSNRPDTYQRLCYPRTISLAKRSRSSRGRPKSAERTLHGELQSMLEQLHALALDMPYAVAFPCPCAGHILGRTDRRRLGIRPLMRSMRRGRT